MGHRCDGPSLRADLPAEADSTEAEAEDDSVQPEIVSFADANLERAVRQALNRPRGPLTTAELASLTHLEANDLNIESLAGLEHCTGLQTLKLQGNQITDVGPLAGLTNLQELSLWGNQIADVSPLTGNFGLDLTSSNPDIADIEANGTTVVRN